MNKRDFDSPLRRQAITYPQIARNQLEGVKRGMRDNRFPPEHILKDINNIYISGCGDCSAAYIALEPLMKSMMGSGTVTADLPVHMSRYVPLYERASNKEDAKHCLMMLLSVAGSPARLVECIRRGRRYGMSTVAVTNSPNSPVASEAEYMLNVNNPPFSDLAPGCRDYFGTMLGTLLLTARISELSGRSQKGYFDSLAADIVRLADIYSMAVKEMDDAMFALAGKIHQSVNRIECIADGSQLASAMFFSAKIIEVCGRYGSFSDSISFRHTGIHYGHAREILTIIYGQINGANKESVSESVRLAIKTGRETLFIADAPAKAFGIDEYVNCYVLPSAATDYSMLSPLFDHLPADLLAAYLSEFWGCSYFRSGLEKSPWKSPGIIAPRNSTIEIVEDSLC